MQRMIPHSRPTLSKDDIDCVLAVLESGHISQGKFVFEFEKRFAKYLDVKGALVVNSGTSALHLCFLALGIKEKDEVILSTYQCSAVLNAILYVGSRPKFADIDADDFNISFIDTKKKLTRKTKAIIVSHMFGSPVDILPFRKLGIPVIEDCAQAIGAEYSGRKVGTFGDLSMTSFYTTKLLTTGEGGMVFSNNLSLLDKVRDLRDYDKKKSFKLRFNYKMTDIQAALGMSQLKKLDKFINQRRYLARRYNKAFSNCDFDSPKSTKGHIYFRYVIRIKKDLRKALNFLKRNNVICERPVYKLLHKYLGQRSYPRAEAAWNSAVSIPIYPSLKPNEQKRVIEVIKKIC
ncbi:MAG: DegT/DnrJ/EryC1/StrS family aminotransferase [Candidatus Omnitrophota bacterium]